VLLRAQVAWRPVVASPEVVVVPQVVLPQGVPQVVPQVALPQGVLPQVVPQVVLPQGVPQVVLPQVVLPVQPAVAARQGAVGRLATEARCLGGLDAVRSDLRRPGLRPPPAVVPFPEEADPPVAPRWRARCALEPRQYRSAAP
jgi:hypothetical protein